MKLFEHVSVIMQRYLLRYNAGCIPVPWSACHLFAFPANFHAHAGLFTSRSPLPLPLCKAAVLLKAFGVIFGISLCFSLFALLCNLPHKNGRETDGQGALPDAQLAHLHGASAQQTLLHHRDEERRFCVWENVSRWRVRFKVLSFKIMLFDLRYLKSKIFLTTRVAVREV
jgi:hypothetical protein